jgi:hypothetical protein
MNKTQMDLLQGTLDMLVLKTLQSGPTHGWDIAQRIQQVSRDVLRVGQGRPERDGLVPATAGAPALPGARHGAVRRAARPPRLLRPVIYREDFRAFARNVRTLSSISDGDTLFVAERNHPKPANSGVTEGPGLNERYQTATRSSRCGPTNRSSNGPPAPVYIW